MLPKYRIVKIKWLCYKRDATLLEDLSGILRHFVAAFAAWLCGLFPSIKRPRSQIENREQAEKRVVAMVVLQVSQLFSRLAHNKQMRRQQRCHDNRRLSIPYWHLHPHPSFPYICHFLKSILIILQLYGDFSKALVRHRNAIFFKDGFLLFGRVWADYFGDSLRLRNERWRRCYGNRHLTTTNELRQLQSPLLAGADQSHQFFLRPDATPPFIISWTNSFAVFHYSLIFHYQ